MTVLGLTLAIALAPPAATQMHDMGGMHMPGMTMPAKPAPARKRKASPGRAAKPTTPAPSPSAPAACPPEHAAMGHCTPAAAPVPGTAMNAMPSPTSSIATPTAAGTDQAAGDALPPPAPGDLAAARFYDTATMTAAARRMRNAHGGMRFGQILFNLAEAQVRNGGDGFRWDASGWFGGDIHRLVIESEGEGRFGERIDSAEVQALYSRTLDPYWNLQAGIRQDLGAGARRTYAAVGIEGLAPYWFDVEGTVFLSDKGDLLGRAEAWYDQRITQRAILQPRAEFNVAAQDMPGSRIGAGLSTAELGLRLRYEIRREFAPYVGASWERRYGMTARYARESGEDTGGLSLVAGVRAWF